MPAQQRETESCSRGVESPGRPLEAGRLVGGGWKAAVDRGTRGPSSFSTRAPERAAAAQGGHASQSGVTFFLLSLRLPASFHLIVAFPWGGTPSSIIRAPHPLLSCCASPRPVSAFLPALLGIRYAAHLALHISSWTSAAFLMLALLPATLRLPARSSLCTLRSIVEPQRMRWSRFTTSHAINGRTAITRTF